MKVITSDGTVTVPDPPAQTTEIHDDRLHIVRFVTVQGGVEVGRRPMRPDEIKSGQWRSPQGGVGWHQAMAPGDYRNLCERLESKGFTPVTAVPVLASEVKLA